MSEERDALAAAMEAAHSAGGLLRSSRGQEKGTQAKTHPRDPVTQFDRLAEEAIVQILRRTFPEDGFLGEEGTAAHGTSGAIWVIDPLDGTVNLARDLPHVGVSIARTRSGAGQVACIHDPWRSETFTAVDRNGAWIGAAPAAVSDQASLDGALIAVGYSFQPERALALHPRILPLLRSGCGVRTTGSAVLDLAYVASGRLDATLYLALHAWDVAAGLLLVQEAGGTATDLEGSPLLHPEGGVLVSNGRLHGALVAVLRVQGEAG